MNSIYKYSYPPIIYKVINEFLDICLSSFCNENLGVLLVGSTSRGEFCWLGDIDNPSLYSDIEFIVVVNDNEKKYEKMFRKKIDYMNENLDYGDKFKIDYVLNTWTGIKKVDKKIFIFDSRNAGVDLGKKPILCELPEVNILNINFKELNDVCLHRMRAVIHDTPEDIFCSKKLFKCI